MVTRNSILIIDDMIVNRLSLRELFQNDYVVLEAENGQEGMDVVESHAASIAIILLDIVMPEVDGYQFLEQMSQKGFLDDIPVIVISAIEGMSAETRSLELGASDLILKPFEPRAVKKRVENVLNAHQYKHYLERLVTSQNNRLVRSSQALLETLNRILRHRNMESEQHNLRIGKYTRTLLDALIDAAPSAYLLTDFDKDLISSATLLHDVGKIVIPDAILNKPGPLTAEEFAIMKTHTEEGSEIIQQLSASDPSDFLRYAYDISRHHHERWNGEGYPDGLRGTAIPVWAQVAGLADVYDALVNKRVYKPAFSHEEAVQLILGGQCGSFSPDLLAAFSKVEQKFRTIAVGCSDETMLVDGDAIITEIAKVISKGTPVFPAVAQDSRYESLLFCVDATVLEVDLDRDAYILVHPQSSELFQVDLRGHFSGMLQQLLSNGVEQGYRQKMTLWFDRALRMLRQNLPVLGDIECRIWNQVYDKPVWYKVIVSNRGNSGQLSRQFLLLFRNINTNIEIRDENKTLLRENELDQMTGVYNKATAESKIKAILDASNDTAKHALLVIDVDDFKVVNDSSGHLAGDRTLRSTAEILRQHVRGTDIVGRVGGDEFIVFMRNIPNASLVENKVDKLVSSFSQSMLDCHINGQHITISVGIALAPQHAQQYAELFECADKALYQAKYCGKAQWRLYATALADNALPADLPGRPIPGDSLECSVFSDTMWKLFLRLEGNEKALPIFMDAIARHFALRSLIIEDVQEDAVFRIFDWYYDPTEKGCSENQYCYAEQGIRTTFAWLTQREISRDIRDWCAVLTRLVVYYHQQKHAEQVHARTTDALKLLLEQFPDGVYAVDGRYDVLFSNARMEALAGSGNSDRKCYKHFFQREEPCTFCPVRRLGRFHEEDVVQVTLGDKLCRLRARGIQGIETNPAYVLRCSEGEEDGKH